MLSKIHNKRKEGGGGATRPDSRFYDGLKSNPDAHSSPKRRKKRRSLPPPGEELGEGRREKSASEGASSSRVCFITSSHKGEGSNVLSRSGRGEKGRERGKI